MPRPARVPRELLDRPFTAATAARYDVTKSALRGGQWWQVIRGVWAHKDLPDNKETRFAALELVLGEREFVCGPTAVWAGFDLDIQDHRSKLLWLGHTPDTWRRPRTGFVIRELDVGPSDLQIFRGTRMTTWLRTAFDCSRWLSLVEAVVIVDALGHVGAITLDDLASYLACHRGVTGATKVAKAIKLADPRSESPMETRVRLLIVLAGLPAPVPQYVISDRSGRFIARADLAYPAQRLVIEYDGAWHWNQRTHDERRRQAMRDVGWTVIVVTADDYYRFPDRLLASIRTRLAPAV